MCLKGYKHVHLTPENTRVLFNNSHPGGERADEEVGLCEQVDVAEDGKKSGVPLADC